MIETDIQMIKDEIFAMKCQLNKLEKHLIPEKKDYSKQSEIVNKAVQEGDASRTFCFNFDCDRRKEKKDRYKECMIGKCKNRDKKPASQPTY